MKLKKSTKEFLIVLSIYFVITCIITFPIIFNINKGVYAIKERFPDVMGSLFNINYYKKVLLTNQSIEWTDRIGYPFGVNLHKTPKYPLVFYTAVLISVISNYIAGHNFTIFLAYTLTGVSMYYLTKYFTKNKTISFIGGFAFVYNTQNLIRGLEHKGLIQLQWICLMILFLFKYRDKPNKKNIGLVGLFFSLITLASWYHGVMAGIFITVFFTIIFLQKKLIKKNKIYLKKIKKKDIIKFSKHILIFSTISIILITPFLLTFLKYSSTGEADYTREFSDLLTYTNGLDEYLTPCTKNPFLGRLGTTRGNITESTYYIGYTLIILAIIGLIKWKSKNKTIIITQMIIFFIFAIGPFLKIQNIKIPLPPYFIYQILPLIRWYARFSIISILMIVILAAQGTKHILKKTRQKELFLILIVALIFIESTIIPPSRTIMIPEITPDIYDWLKNTDYEIIAEYPMHYEYRSPYDRYYQLYSLTHNKKIINGINTEEGMPYWDMIRHIKDDMTPGILKHLGADLVLIHNKMPFYNNITYWEYKNIGRIKGLRKIKTIGKVDAYEITATKPETIPIITKGSHYGVLDVLWENVDEKMWRLMNNESEIKIISSKTPKTVNLTMEIHQFMNPRTLKIYFDEEKIREEQIIFPTTLRIPLNLTRKEHTIRITSNTYDYPVGKHWIDDPVSFLLSNINIE